MRVKTKQLLEENNRAEESLSAEGRELLTDLVVYLRGSRISTWDQEQVRRDITQMLLDAETRGERAETVIGPDPKEFCDNIIAELPPMPRLESLLCMLRDGLLASVVLMAIWIGFGILEGVLRTGGWPELTLTVGQLLSGTGILFTACGVVYWICRRSFTADRGKGPWILLFLILFVLLCAGIFLRHPVATLSVPSAVCIVAVLFIVYKIMDIRLD